MFWTTAQTSIFVQLKDNQWMLYYQEQPVQRAWGFLLGRGFPGGASGKEPTCQCWGHKRCKFDPWVRKIPWKRAWQRTPAFLPGESHGQRSLVGSKRVGHNWLTNTFRLSAIVLAEDLAIPSLCVCLFLIFILHCGIWDLVSQPGIEPRPCALGAQF